MIVRLQSNWYYYAKIDKDSIADSGDSTDRETGMRA